MFLIHKEIGRAKKGQGVGFWKHMFSVFGCLSKSFSTAAAAKSLQ